MKFELTVKGRNSREIQLHGLRRASSTFRTGFLSKLAVRILREEEHLV